MSDLEHVHGCPSCYQKVPCWMPCHVEPDLSQDEPTGFYVVCEVCEATKLAREAAADRPSPERMAEIKELDNDLCSVLDCLKEIKAIGAERDAALAGARAWKDEVRRAISVRDKATEEALHALRRADRLATASLALVERHRCRYAGCRSLDTKGDPPLCNEHRGGQSPIPTPDVRAEVAALAALLEPQ